MIDEAFERLHMRTENTRLLRDSVSTEPVVFVKARSLASAPRFGTNRLVMTSSVEIDPDTGQFVEVLTPERRITLSEWDETNEAENATRVNEVPREISHSWNSEELIGDVVQNENGLWHSFLARSGWTQTAPNDFTFFEVSGDNQWWYRDQVSIFTEEFSTFNPAEDWGSLWRLYFEPGQEVERNRMEQKLEWSVDSTMPFKSSSRNSF